MAEATTGIDLLIVGAGMYVCGKGSAQSFGTILPAALEAGRTGLVRSIHIAAHSASSAREAKAKGEKLQELMGVTLPITVSPGSGSDQAAYLKAADELPAGSAAIISVPDHLHFEVTAALIKRCFHVQVVKPLVMTVAQTRQLISLKNDMAVLGLVEFHKRFDSSNLKLRELIEADELGELLNFRIQFSQRKTIPCEVFRSWVGQTNILQYLGVHYVDLIHFLTGALPRRVMSYGQHKYLVGQGIDSADTIQTQVEWQQDDGSLFLSSHLSGWVDSDSSSAMSDQRLEVVGTKGRCLADQKHRGMSLAVDGRAVEEINPYFTQLYPSVDGRYKRASGYGPESIISFVEDVNAIRAGHCQATELAGLRATFESSLVVAAVLEASEQSLATDNGWVQTESLQGEVAL